MEIQFAARTDVGRSRDHNEDNFLVDPRLQLFIVADGMGGHSAGEVASAMAVNHIRAAVASSADLLERYRSDQVGRDEIASVLEHAVQAASHQIFEAGLNNPRQRGMGTTVTSLLVVGSQGFIAHVGDSRLYLLRDGEVHLLTEDHSLLNELMKHGKVKSQKDLDPRFKNAVTRAVGVHETIEVDLFLFDLLPGDRVLICSDGLHGYLDNDRVRELSALESLESSVEEYVQFANRKGGQDNITCVVVEAIDETHDHADVRLKFNTMRHLSLFRYLNYQEIVRLLDVTEERRVDAGESLFAEGDDGDELYVLLDGEVALQKSDVLLKRLGPGSHFGEMALAETTLRQADAIALTDVRVLVLSRAHFFDVLRGNAPLAVKMLWSFVRALSERVRHTTEELVAIKQAVANGEDPEPLLGPLMDLLPVADLNDDSDGGSDFPEALAPLAAVSTGAPPPPPPPITPSASSASSADDA